MTLASIETQAEDHTSLDTPPGSIRLEVNGQTGVWLPLNMARSLQLDVERLMLKDDALYYLRSQLETKQERLDGCHEVVALTENALEKSHEVVEELEDEVTNLEGRDAAWYRHPATLIGAGVVLTVALEIAAIFIFNAL
jgi:hypothetical protein